MAVAWLDVVMDLESATVTFRAPALSTLFLGPLFMLGLGMPLFMYWALRARMREKLRHLAVQDTPSG